MVTHLTARSRSRFVTNADKRHPTSRTNGAPLGTDCAPLCPCTTMAQRVVLPMLVCKAHVSTSNRCQSEHRHRKALRPALHTLSCMSGMPHSSNDVSHIPLRLHNARQVGVDDRSLSELSSLYGGTASCCCKCSTNSQQLAFRLVQPH